MRQKSFSTGIKKIVLHFLSGHDGYFFIGVKAEQFSARQRFILVIDSPVRACYHPLTLGAGIYAMNQPSERVTTTLVCIGMCLIWYTITQIVSALPNYAELRRNGMLMPVLCLLEFAVLVPLYRAYCRRYRDILPGDIRTGQLLVFSLLLLGLIFSQSFYLQKETWTASQVGEGTEGMLPFVLAVVLLAPVFEEILFRGFLLQGLLTWLPKQRLACALLTSFAFAAAHTQYVHLQTLIALTLLSLLLCYARLRSGGLKLPVFLHMLNNFIGVSPWLWLALAPPS